MSNAVALTTGTMGAGKFVAGAGSDLTKDARQALLKRMMEIPESDGDAVFLYLKQTTEPEAAKGLRSLLEATAPCVL